MHNVQTLQMSATVLQLAQLDSVLRYRLAGVSNLIVSETKYHLVSGLLQRFCEEIQ